MAPEDTTTANGHACAGCNRGRIGDGYRAAFHRQPQSLGLDTPEPAPEVTSTFGQTEDGLYFRGNPAAAVTVIDYSDFL